jgi:hypothetical protein
MKITIDLDGGAYQLASLYANARGLSTDMAIGELINKALRPARPSRITKSSNGFPLLPKRGGPRVTSKLVKKLAEELD